MNSQKTITFIVSLALFMDALDATIINTAIPAMAHSLSVNPVDLKVALISYLLSLAIFIPISGWVADKFGTKRVFITALGLFTLSSFWCGNAHSLMELVIARSAQGLGGSLMLPLGRLIILRTFPRHEYIEAMNAVIMVVSLGIMLGPLAGGIITDHLSWQWIFWVNIPVGLLTIIMAIRWLKDEAPKKIQSLDVLGFILFGGGLATLIFSLSHLSESTADPSMTFSMLGLSIFMLITYCLHSSKKHYPIINRKLLRIRTFQVSVTSNLLSRLGFGGIPFLLPLLFQVGLGFTAQLSGLLLTPIALGILLIKFKSLSTRVLRLLGHKRLLLINTFFITLSLLSFEIINAQTSVYLIALLTFIFGFFISLQYSGMNSLAYAEIQSEDLSAAASIMSITQQLSQSLGVATSALLLRYYSPDSTQHFLLIPPVFHQTFIALALMTALSTIIFLRLKTGDGRQMLTKDIALTPK